MRTDVARAHALIPTPAETQSKPELFFSDSLPVLANIPINTLGAGNESLHILSFHVVGQGVANNVLQSRETDEQAVSRYDRIGEGLKTCARRHKLDVILLQGVTSDFMRQKLLGQLGADWVLASGLDGSPAPVNLTQLTIYNKTRLNLLVSPKWDDVKKTLSTGFSANGVMIYLHHVNTGYHVKLEEVENYYQSLLLQNPGCCSIVFGGTGARVTLSEAVVPKNLTTAITRPVHQDIESTEIEQKPECTIGGFYTNTKDHIFETMILAIDIGDGAPVSDFRDRDDILGKVAVDPHNAWFKPQPMLCLSSYYQGAKLVQGGMTIFECENRIREQLNDGSAIVRVSSTIFNERGFCVRINSDKRKYAAFGKEEIGQAIFSLLPKGSSNMDFLDSGPDRFVCFYLKPDAMIDFMRVIDFVSEVQSKAQEALKLEELPEKANRVIQQAVKDYGSVLESKGFDAPKKAEDVLWSLGAVIHSVVFRSISRLKVVEARVAVAKRPADGSSDEVAPHVVLLKLWQEDNGTSLRSFRYFLASYFMGIKARSNAEAALLIKVSITRAQNIIPAEIPSSLALEDATAGARLPTRVEGRPRRATH